MEYIENLENPLNTNERYLYGINVRLNVLIEMFSSFLDVYAKQNNVSTTSNQVVEEITISLDEDVEKEIGEMQVITDYNKLTKSEIIDILTLREIEFNTRMTKAELIELLK